MLFTVCTPTFNRAHTLHRVFMSLEAQTLQDFEWIVIDDGSTDNTKSLVHDFVALASFPIRYEFQQNQGKHIAVNRCAQLANGEFFLIADSDDRFHKNALEIFNKAFQEIPVSERDAFTGVTGLCTNEKGDIVGDIFPQDKFDSTPMDTTYRYKVRGEKWGFHRTRIIREFPFPEVVGVKFFPEGVVWNKIGQQYKTRYINKPVRQYKQDASSQLTKMNWQDRSATRVAYSMLLDIDSEYMFIAPLRFYKFAIQGVRYSLHQSDSLSMQFGRLERLKSRYLWAAALIPGWLFYRLDQIKGLI